MKKINILLVGFLLMIGFNACQEDPIVTINPLAETGEMGFKLNQTRYANYTYELLESNNDLDMEALYASQPDYFFTAAVTYYIQASFNENMSDSVELPSSVQGEKVAINTKEMNKALLQLYKGEMPQPTVAKDVFVRLKAIISTATPTPLDTIPTVKPLYSNVVKLNVLPYFMQDLVSYDAAKKLTYWYIIGLGDGNWKNELAGVGPSLFPLSVVDGNMYDGDGNGTFVYTGYIKASQSFKLIRDLGSWDTQWGNNGSAGINNPVMKNPNLEPANFQVPEDGYYSVKLNSISNTVVIEKIEVTPPSYSKIGLIGVLGEWGADNVELQPFQTDNNHAWYVTYTISADTQCKLRANSSWDVNWGTPSTFDGDPIYSAQGLGILGGKNMFQAAGTYVILFNDVDGFYTFIKK